MFTQYRKHTVERLLFNAISLISIVVIFLNSGQRYDFVVLSIFSLIGILSLYGIFISVDQRSYSLNKTFCLFYYFFFSIAPAIQFKNKSAFFITEYLSKEIYINAGFILFTVLISYLIGYHLLFKFLNKLRNHFSYNKAVDFNKLNSKIILVVFYAMSIMSLLLYLFLIKFDWSLLVFRPFLFRLKDNTHFGLIGYSLVLIIQFIPVIVLMYYQFIYEKINRHTLIFLLIVLLISFPSALSRGLLAIIYIPIFILLIPTLRKGVNYVLLFMGGVLVVFPIFNNFRYLKEGVFRLNYELFDSGHFDAFQNFALLIDEHIITHGKQLLGSLFFFVQESNWLNKAVGTGQLLGETVGYSYLNVSMPFFGEGFANWGYVGIAVFLIVLLLFNVIFDFYIKVSSHSKILNSLFFFMLGFEFYLLRGDLMSSLKIFTSIFIALVIVEAIRLLTVKIAVKSTKNE